MVAKAKLCGICLGSGHGSPDCPRRYQVTHGSNRAVGDAQGVGVGLSQPPPTASRADAGPVGSGGSIPQAPAKLTNAEKQRKYRDRQKEGKK